MSDLSRNFYSKDRKKAFLNQLNITTDQESILLNQKNKISDVLREEIAEFTHSPEGGGKKIVPRFLPQGSWTYKTMNQPCHKPPQQVDFDLGVYLPRSYMEKDKPTVASEMFFGVVDEALIRYASENGYKHKKKRTCSRIVVNSEIHVDIPLYIINDTEFSQLRKNVAGGVSESLALDSVDNFHDFFEAARTQTWEELDADKVWLATRNEGWIDSDPRKIFKWFEEAVLQHGPQLRRVCRYIKSWRDYKWTSGGPTSIFLMICTVELFQAKPGRDDLAFLHVLEELPKRLFYPVTNPTDEKEILSDRIGRETIAQTKTNAYSFSLDLADAIEREIFENDACRKVQKHLGSRFSLLENDSGIKSRKAVLGTVATIGSQKVAANVPRRTTAG